MVLGSAHVVEHEVAVVTIPEHEDPHDDGVGGEGCAKLVLRCFDIFRLWRAVALDR